MVVAVNQKFGTKLAHLQLFDYPSIRELAAFVGQEIAQATPVQPAPISTPTVARPKLSRRIPVRRTMAAPATRRDERIAIVGMSGRYPKASCLDEYWENLAAGRNAVSEVPAERWDVSRHYDPDRSRGDKTYSKWLGALDDVDRFDPLFFRISPQEAEYMDPQHRLFLQESYRTFEDAGYCGTTLSNKKCGFYLGIPTNEYMSLLVRTGAKSAPVTSNSYAIAAARIAYHLNLKGAAVSVDTACSSSLVAIHLACQAMLNGDIVMALAGGVSRWLTPQSYVAMSQANMFSPSGQCKTFDDSADGIVNGEGVGAVVLKRLADARADGDHIYGEAHGTGTRLGDPIELQALGTVFREKTAKKNFCAVGSVKSNVGHTTAAAGVAGLHKVLLSMQHRTLVPTLNVSTENSRFDFAASPFYVNRETRPWESADGTPRRAALSSFGYSGTNAHLVIEEYAADAPPIAADRTVIVPLSARTAEQLRQRAADLLRFVRGTSQPIDLAALACTLQIGREAMEERAGFIVGSIAQLAEKLAAFVEGEKNIDDVRQGRVEAGNDTMSLLGRDEDMQETIEKWIGRGKLAKLLDLWIRGLPLDWIRLQGEAKPRRMPLPTYPFAKDRYWIDGAAPSSPAPESAIVFDANVQAIEDIINSIDDDTLDETRAVGMLRMLV